MKSPLPFIGVQTTPLVAACGAVFSSYALDSFDEWRATVLALSRSARFREERYAANLLAGAKPYARFRTPDALPLYEELVVTGAWWDLVDWVATRLLRELHDRFPAEARAAMLTWSRDGDLWKRRAAVISQVGRRGRTDRELLAASIEGSIADREFFARKAIGWALRDYSKTDGDWVRRYVAANDERLSALSRREALKWLEHVHVPRGGRARA